MIHHTIKAKINNRFDVSFNLDLDYRLKQGDYISAELLSENLDSWFPSDDGFSDIYDKLPKAPDFEITKITATGAESLECHCLGVVVENL